MSKFLIRWNQKYNELKLKSLIKILRKKYGNKVEIKIFTTRSKPFRLCYDIQTISSSDFRIDIEKEEFDKIKVKVLDNVKSIMIKIFDELRTSKDFYLEEIFLGKLIEFWFAAFLKKMLGELEILRRILKSEKYDKGILFDFNQNLSPFLINLHKEFRNLEIVKDPLLKQLKNSSFWFFSKYIIGLLGSSIKTRLFKKRSLKNWSIQKSKNILFVSNTINQFESIKKIHNYYEEKKDYGAILYHSDYSLPLNEITNLLRFCFQIRNIWLKDQKKIMRSLSYDSIKLKQLLKEYYKFEMFFALIKIFNSIKNFKQILKTHSFDLVILADELMAEARSYAKYCKIQNIPTIYIPHAGIPDYADLTEKTDFKYITVPGELDKKYLIEKGFPNGDIIVTGRSRYDKFFEGKIKRINEVKDHFDNRVYKFDPNKFTILYTKSNIGRKVGEKFDKSVLHALNELNLIENLVIKLHPDQKSYPYKWVLEEFKGKTPVIVKDYDIFELIKSSNLLLSQSSYTIVEAMIVGTPVIVLDFINVDFFFSGTYKYYDEKDLITVKNQKSLTDSLNKLIKDKNFYIEYSEKLKQLAKGYLFNDGIKTATEHVVSLIEKTI